MKFFAPHWTEGWKQLLIICYIMNGARGFTTTRRGRYFISILEMGKTQGQEDGWFQWLCDSSISRMTNSGNIRETALKSIQSSPFVLQKGKMCPIRERTHSRLPSTERRDSKCSLLRAIQSMSNARWPLFTNHKNTLCNGEKRALNGELKDLDPVLVLPSKLDFPLWILSPPGKIWGDNNKINRR